MASFPFAINGITLDGKSSLPALKYQGASYSRSAVDGSSAGRNQKGKMIRDLITSKDKWQLEFVPCSGGKLAALLTILDKSSFSFTYPDPRTGSITTGTFYVGDRSAPVYIVKDGEVGLWGNLTFDVIEI